MNTSPLINNINFIIEDKSSEKLSNFTTVKQEMRFHFDQCDFWAYLSIIVLFYYIGSNEYVLSLNPHKLTNHHTED